MRLLLCKSQCLFGIYGMLNPLQYSCLENHMDREPWQATVRRVAKSGTRLKPLSTHAWYVNAFISSFTIFPEFSSSVSLHWFSFLIDYVFLYCLVNIYSNKMHLYLKITSLFSLNIIWQNMKFLDCPLFSSSVWRYFSTFNCCQWEV